MTDRAEAETDSSVNRPPNATLGRRGRDGAVVRVAGGPGRVSTATIRRRPRQRVVTELRPAAT